jgi:hypothetical protein
MKYGDIEYNVVQGIERKAWKWSASFEGITVHGQAETKADAIAETQRAIDRKLTPKKVRLVKPD